MKYFYPLKYEDIVFKSSKEYNVDKKLIYAIIKCESGFDKHAHSKANARGLMQLTPETFNWLKTCYTHQNNLDEFDLEDPETNIRYGTLFLSILLDKYKNEKTAISAYNAGINAVDKWLLNKEYSNDGLKLLKTPYKETNEYVKRVKNAKKVYNKLYFKGEVANEK